MYFMYAVTYIRKVQLPYKTQGCTVNNYIRNPNYTLHPLYGIYRTVNISMDVVTPCQYIHVFNYTVQT